MKQSFSARISTFVAPNTFSNPPIRSNSGSFPKKRRSEGEGEEVYSKKQKVERNQSESVECDGTGSGKDLGGREQQRRCVK
jgi:hypothetical protein